MSFWEAYNYFDGLISYGLGIDNPLSTLNECNRNNTLIIFYVASIVYNFYICNITKGVLKKINNGLCKFEDYDATQYNDYIINLQKKCLEQIITTNNITVELLTKSKITVIYMQEFINKQKKLKFYNFKDGRTTEIIDTNNQRYKLVEHIIDPHEYAFIDYYSVYHKRTTKGRFLFTPNGLIIKYSADYYGPYNINLKKIEYIPYMDNVYSTLIDCISYDTAIPRILYELIQKNNHHKTNKSLPIEFPCGEDFKTFSYSLSQTYPKCDPNPFIKNNQDINYHFFGNFSFDKCIKLIQISLISSNPNNPWTKYSLKTNKHLFSYKNDNKFLFNQILDDYNQYSKSHFITLRKKCYSPSPKNIKKCIDKMYIALLLTVIDQYTNHNLIIEGYNEKMLYDWGTSYLKIVYQLEIYNNEELVVYNKKCAEKTIKHTNHIILFTLFVTLFSITFGFILLAKIAKTNELG